MKLEVLQKQYLTIKKQLLELKENSKKAKNYESQKLNFRDDE